MKTAKMFVIHALALAVVPIVLFADRTPPAGIATLYGDWSIAQGIWTDTKVWTNSTDSTRIAWQDGSYGIVQDAWKNNNSFQLHGLHFWGLKWDIGSSKKRWANSSINVWFGEGGLEMSKSGGVLRFGDKNGAARVCLVADQTWTGPESGSAHFALGHDDYDDYYKLSANASGCSSWTLEKGLNVWITWTNSFSETDITVNYPARIWLERKWQRSSILCEGLPALGAKTLTLVGDGVMWEAGGQSSVQNGYKNPTLEAEMNSSTVTPDLTLKDGADLLGSSAGWDIPTLRVTGSGESAFTGSWTFRRATTDVSIASGAVLALTGDVADGDEPAGLNVTGSGVLKIDISRFRITGPLTLGDDVTLVLSGSGVFQNRITGCKEIRINPDGEDPNIITLASSSTAGFTGGRIVVVSGKAAVEDKPAGVEIVEEGGTYVDLSAASDDEWIVTDFVRTEESISVDSGKTLCILGNGLTSNTTLILNGGRLSFARSAAVASPINVTATSSIGSESYNVTGTVLGKIEGLFDSGTKTLKLAGAGTVNLAGGCNISHMNLYVTEGRCNLMSNRFEYAYANIGITEEGEYMGVRDGAYVYGAWPSTGGVYGICSRSGSGAHQTLFEICSNSTVYCSQNITAYLGSWSIGTLRLSGGKLIVCHGSKFYVGHTDGNRGVFEMNDGLFETDQPFWVGLKATGNIIWRGGCIKLGSDFWTYAGTSSHYLDGVSSNLTFTIAGSDCVLDLNRAVAFTNVFANERNVGSWRWEEGGRLTVTNGGTFVMNRFPENGRVAVKDCSLLIADEAEPLIGELGFAGTTNDVISGAAGLNLSAQGVRVLPGGEWRPSQVDGISWSDLAFDTGAIYSMSMTGDNTLSVCTVPGQLFLGDTLGFRLMRNGYSLTGLRTAAIQTGGGVSGSAESFPVVPAKWVALEAEGDTLWLTYRPKGTVFTLR